MDLVIAKERKGYLDVWSPTYFGGGVPTAEVFRQFCLKALPTRGRLMDVYSSPGTAPYYVPQPPDSPPTGDGRPRPGTAPVAVTTPPRAARKTAKTVPPKVNIHATRSGRSLE